MLRAEGIEVWRGNTRVIDGLDMNVAPGGVTALLGGNGSGKSTTLFAFSGLVPVRKGRILLGERDVTGMSANQMLAAGVSHVPQGREVFPTLTVRENLETGTAVVRGRRRQRERIEAVLELFPRLRVLLRRPAGALSGGEQQQLAIARAMVPDPQVLLMDEPSAGLSPRIVDTLIETIESLRRRGLSILLVEQNVGVAVAVADRALVLKAGVIALERPAKDLFSESDLLSAYLGK